VSPESFLQVVLHRERLRAANMALPQPLTGDPASDLFAEKLQSQLLLLRGALRAAAHAAGEPDTHPGASGAAAAAAAGGGGGGAGAGGASTGHGGSREQEGAAGGGGGGGGSSWGAPRRRRAAGAGGDGAPRARARGAGAAKPRKDSRRAAR
jgi:hypothetical protein